MLSYFKNRLLAAMARKIDPGSSREEEEAATRLTGDLSENMIALRQKYQNSSDFLSREITIGKVRMDFLLIEGMVNLQTMSEMLLEPLLNQKFNREATPDAIYRFIEGKTVLAADQKDLYTYEEIFQFIMSGFVVVLIDGLDKGIAFGLQGFNFRSISEPSSEMNELGSREGFTEPLRINMTMVRRRIKSPKLKFELSNLGSASKTVIFLIYMRDMASP